MKSFWNLKNRVAIALFGCLLFVAAAVVFYQEKTEAEETTVVRKSGTYLLSNLPIYRMIGPNSYKIDASAFVELANLVAFEDELRKVTFDENTLALTITSTPEVLKRFDDRFIQFHSSMGVRLKTRKIDAQEIQQLISSGTIEFKE